MVGKVEYLIKRLIVSISCLHIIKGGGCKDGIATIFELYVNNSSINKHIVVSILPVRYANNIKRDVASYTLCSLKFNRIIALFKTLRLLSVSDRLVIKTWGHAATFVSKVFRKLLIAPVVWGIHDSGPGEYRLIKWLVHLNRKDSYTLPDSIICASQATLQVYKNVHGYDQRRLNYIPNGLDSDKFHFNSANNELREKLNIPAGVPVIGIVARYSKVKGVDVFIDAMQQLSKELPNAKFIFCGHRMDTRNKTLIKKLHKRDLLKDSILMGQRNDMPSIYSLMDILVLPSKREALSCCLMEAMSCGIACLATDVGDSGLIIGDTGRLLPYPDSDKVKEACLSLLCQSEEAKIKLKNERRDRVIKRFDLKTFIEKYDRVLNRLEPTFEQLKLKESRQLEA